MKPHINVVGAAILKNGKLLALRRSDGNESVIHKFEFVGGKVKKGESPQQALIRECMEEISLEIEVGELLNTVDYEYSDCVVSLSVYFVKALSDYKLSVHEEERWIDCSEIDPSDWAPADSQFLTTLKQGYMKMRAADTPEDFALMRELASEIMHTSFDETLPAGQVDYMIELNLSDSAVNSNVALKEYTYSLIYLNGEIAGFCAYCPARYFSEEYEGTFLSKLYLKEFARGRRITSKLLDYLRRPVYLTVKRDNVQAINVYKHCGFKIVQNVSTDIGSGYVMEDFIMVLNK